MEILPTARQLEFLDWEMGAFFHFGIRTFYHGHTDWDGKPMPLSGFCPTALDCEQWIRTVKEAGMSYAILTAKHHDGFANWPSAYTEYSVKNTPYKDGKGDIVREFVDACRKYGVKVGLYYSPAQWGEGAVPFSCEKEYDDYFINQISELLTGYGKIDYLWFDGCGSENHEYDRDRIMTAIREMQPDILTFHMWDTDVRWIGNEDGYAHMMQDCEVERLDFSVRTDAQMALKTRTFVPAECDFRIRSTWFDEDNLHTLKQTDELLGIYEMSVGRGSNFLLNIGPDQRGLLPEEDSARLLEFGKAVKARYQTALDYTPVQAAEQKGCYTVSYAAQCPYWELPLCNRAVIGEDLTRGQNVLSFRLNAYLPGNRDKKICLMLGQTVGHKRICTFPTMRSAKYELEVTDARGEVHLRDLKLYYVP